MNNKNIIIRKLDGIETRLDNIYEEVKAWHAKREPKREES